MKRIFAISGSLRAQSTNSKIIQYLADLSGELFRLNIYQDLSRLPAFNPDLDAEGSEPPAEVSDFRKKIRESDGVLICTPEYVFGVPGALKNAIDWASRKSEDYAQIEVFKGKCAAIMTASPGAFGGLRCLAHLRGVLTIMLVNVLPSEIAVAQVGAMFEGDSEEMTDEKMKGILHEVGASLVDNIRRMHGEFEVVEEAGQ